MLLPCLGVWSSLLSVNKYTSTQKCSAQKCSAQKNAKECTTQKACNPKATMYACGSILAWNRIMQSNYYKTLSYEKMYQLGVLSKENVTKLEASVDEISNQIRDIWNLKPYDILLLTSALLPETDSLVSQNSNVLYPWNVSIFEKRIEEYKSLQRLLMRWNNAITPSQEKSIHTLILQITQILEESQDNPKNILKDNSNVSDMFV